MNNLTVDISKYTQEIGFITRGSFALPHTKTRNKFILQTEKVLPTFRLTKALLSRIKANLSKVTQGYLSGVKVMEQANNYSLQHLTTIQGLGDIQIPCRIVTKNYKEGENFFQSMVSQMKLNIEKSSEKDEDLINLCPQFFKIFNTGKELVFDHTILYPFIAIQLQEIEALKIIESPLTKILLGNGLSKCYKSGYLTLDNQGRVLTLLKKDPLSYRYPIVGIWIKGTDLAQTQVYGSILQYLEFKQIQKVQISSQAKKFLVLQFDTTPKFYIGSLLGENSWKIIQTEQQTIKSIKQDFEIDVQLNQGRQETLSTNSSFQTNRSLSPFELIKRHRISESPIMTKRKNYREQNCKSLILHESQQQSLNAQYRKTSIIESQSSLIQQLQAQIQDLQQRVRV